MYILLERLKPCTDNETIIIGLSNKTALDSI